MGDLVAWAWPVAAVVLVGVVGGLLVMVFRSAPGSGEDEPGPGPLGALLEAMERRTG